MGETHWGGLAQVARLKGDWLVPLPAAFTGKQAMAIGTAGYTAALCVDALVKFGVTPDQGEILVTGATGGLGSVAIALLKKAGFTIAAATGKAREGDYLKQLGAETIVDRAELSAPGKPMQKERWAGVIDSVGSQTLANAVAQTKYRGAVAACGLAQGADFPATVMPFILRGVTLAGVDSVWAPREKREEAWGRLSTDLDIAKLDSMTARARLDDVPSLANEILAGNIKGRMVIDL